jgi:hypothetical protein
MIADQTGKVGQVVQPNETALVEAFERKLGEV